MHREDTQKCLGVASIKLIMTLLGPLPAELARRPPDRLGHVAEVALGVIAIDDLDGAGEELVGEVPDPQGAVTEDGLSVSAIKPPPACLAPDALGKLGGKEIGVAAGPRSRSPPSR